MTGPEAIPGSFRIPPGRLHPDVARFEALVDYGSARIRQISAERGIDWDRLSEDERERLIDDILHEEYIS